MKPKINSTSFGSVKVKGKLFKHGILIRLNGKVEKRRKKLSKKLYETLHKISLEEAKYIYENGAEELIMRTGQTGYVEISKKAEKYFRKKHCKVKLLPTPKAIKIWNKRKGKAIAMFHVTC